MQVLQADPPPAAPPAPRGQLVTLHDGRQVDSWSTEWRDECLASTLVQLSNSDRSEWFAGYADVHGQQAEQDLRRLVRAVAKAREGDNPRRR
jgi:hypothetical protein